MRNEIHQASASPIPLPQCGLGQDLQWYATDAIAGQQSPSQPTTSPTSFSLLTKQARLWWLPCTSITVLVLYWLDWAITS